MEKYGKLKQLLEANAQGKRGRINWEDEIERKTKGKRQDEENGKKLDRMEEMGGNDKMMD